jgi:hypothetical protein
MDLNMNDPIDLDKLFVVMREFWNLYTIPGVVLDSDEIVDLEDAFISWVLVNEGVKRRKDKIKGDIVNEMDTIMDELDDLSVSSSIKVRNGQDLIASRSDDSEDSAQLKMGRSRKRIEVVTEVRLNVFVAWLEGVCWDIAI